MLEDDVKFSLVCGDELGKLLLPLNAVNAFGSGSGVKSVPEGERFGGSDGV